MNPIDFSKLINFTNSKDVDDAITKIALLESVYESLIKEAKGNSGVFAKAIEGITKEVDELIKKIKPLNINIKEHREELNKAAQKAETLSSQEKKLADSQKANAKESSKLTQELQKIRKVRVQLTKTQKEEVTLVSKLTGLQSAQAKVNAQLRLRIQEKNKALKEEAMNTIGLLRPYKKQSKLLNDLRLKYKDLTVTQGSNGKEALRLKKRIDLLDNRLKKADANVGQFQRNVGNYGKAWSSVGNILRSAGVIGGIAGVISVIKNSIKIFANFEQAVDSLSSITGAVGGDLQFYREAAVQMGATTTKTATEVLKAFELVGSARPELLKSKEALTEVTGAAIVLAEAAKIDVPAAAKALASGLNQFKLPARDAARIINVLAAGSKEGAAAIPEVTEAIDKFGSIARTAGISIEASVAAIEAIAPAGLVGAEAGTKLRNVLLELQAGADETNPAIVGFDQALENLGKQELSITQLTKRFGKQNVLAAKTLIEERGEVKRLTTALTGSSVAYDQASTNVDNLKGDVAALSSAWEGLILGAENGEGVFNNFLRTVIRGFTKLLNLFSGVEKSFSKMTDESVNLAKSNLNLANSSQKLLDEYEDLKKDGIEPTKEETQRLTEIEILLTAKLGESVRVINEQTGAFELNTDAVRQQIKLKRLAFDAEASQLASRLKGAKDAIIIAKEELELARLQVEAAKRLAESSGIFEAQRKARKEGNQLIGGFVKLTQEQIEIQDILNKSRGKVITSTAELNEQMEREKDLIAALAELNFSEADAEALLAEVIEDVTEAIEDNTDAEKENAKSKKEAEALAKRVAKALFELEKFRLEQLISINQEILNDEENTLNARLIANKNASDQRMQLALFEKDFLLSNSKLLADERLLIQEESDEKLRQIARDSVESLNELLATSDSSFDIDDILNDRLTKNQIALNEELQLLNEQLAAKEISADQFEQSRLAALTQFHAKQIDDELSFLETSLLIFAETEEEKLAIQKRISELRLQASNRLTSKLIENEQILKDTINELGAVGAEAAELLNQTRIEKEDERIEADLERLTEEKEGQLAVVGDDAQARAFIEENFARKQEVLKDQQAKNDRKRARSEKALEIIRSIINTAAAVVKLGVITPQAIAAGIVGAATTALIAAQPIPGFYKGTKDAPGGPAMLHEKGPEVVITPDGKIRYDKSSKPSVENLPKHSTVIPAHESVKFMSKIHEDRAIISEYDRRKEIQYVLNQQKNDKLLTESVERTSKEMIGAIKSMPQDVYDEKGYRRYTNRANVRIQSLNKRNSLGAEG